MKLRRMQRMNFIKDIEKYLCIQVVYSIILNNDFPQCEIKQIIEDIRTYGNIATAKGKLKREYEGETEFLFDSS